MPGRPCSAATVDALALLGPGDGVRPAAFSSRSRLDAIPSGATGSRDRLDRKWALGPLSWPGGSWASWSSPRPRHRYGRRSRCAPCRAQRRPWSCAYQAGPKGRRWTGLNDGFSSSEHGSQFLPPGPYATGGSLEPLVGTAPVQAPEMQANHQSPGQEAELLGPSRLTSRLSPGGHDNAQHHEHNPDDL